MVYRKSNFQDLYLMQVLFFRNHNEKFYYKIDNNMVNCYELQCPLLHNMNYPFS